MKYNLLNTYDEFSADKSQESPDPTPSVEMVVLGPESIPLSILDHPLGKGTKSTLLPMTHQCFPLRKGITLC